MKGNTAYPTTTPTKYTTLNKAIAEVNLSASSRFEKDKGLIMMTAIVIQKCEFNRIGRVFGLNAIIILGAKSPITTR